MASPCFTLEEASALLPWLRKALGEVRDLRERTARLTAEMRQLSVMTRSNGGGLEGKQLAEKDKELTAANESIRNKLDEVQRKGIIVRDIDKGLVDFPALRKGREVYLCWLLDEDAIRFWHPTDTGFSGRQPL